MKKSLVKPINWWRSLVQQTAGVLLLTATPEQLGVASHFARLKLLDPKRFSSLDNFLDEEEGYLPIAQAARQLVRGKLKDEHRVLYKATWVMNLI
jgi:ATP-dependent helicase HepA